jgi:mycofactocin precursor
MESKQLLTGLSEESEKSRNILEKPENLEEIVIEELSIDGICGVY